MKTLTTDEKEQEIGTTQNHTMETSIVDTMRRYFRDDTGRQRADLEYAIIDSVKRYFESPRQ